MTTWPFYYGWVIVLLALLSMGFWAGLRSCFAVFYASLLNEFPWTRGGAAGVQSLAYLVYVVLAPLAGGLIDRFGPKRITLPGIVLLSLGLLLSAKTESLFQFYLFYGLVVGTGITFISITVYSPILANWFQKKRGVASGFAASGMGLGTFFLVPLSQYLISAWGWRLGFVVLGALVSVILLPTTLLFLRQRPEDLGLVPDGSRDPVLSESREDNVVDPEWARTSWTLGKALRTKRYWALMAFSFFVITGVYLMIMHCVRFLVDQGLDPMSAASILALVGIVSIPARIFWGWLSDRMGREITFTMGAFFVAVAACSLIFIEARGQTSLAYGFAVCLGLGWGVTAPMFLSISADLFQGRGFGLIYGMVETVIGGGCALGVWMGGFIFDRTQSYQWAFVLAGSVSLFSIPFAWATAPRRIRLPRRWGRRKIASLDRLGNHSSRGG